MPSLHPEFIKNMTDLLGGEVSDFLRALDEDYSAALRINPLRANSAAAAEGFIADPVPWARYGHYIKENTRPGAGLAHFAGAFYIQEASAMLPAAVLDVQPGEKVLDLCAAPGGKSSQMAAALMGEGVLVSNEPDTKRARMLAGNLERLGVKNAVVVNEYPPKLAEKWPGFFDAILVTRPAPARACSAANPIPGTNGSRAPRRAARSVRRASSTTPRKCSGPAGAWSIPPAPTTPPKTKIP